MLRSPFWTSLVEQQSSLLTAMDTAAPHATRTTPASTVGEMHAVAVTPGLPHYQSHEVDQEGLSQSVVDFYNPESSRDGAGAAVITAEEAAQMMEVVDVPPPPLFDASSLARYRVHSVFVELTKLFRYEACVWCVLSVRTSQNSYYSRMKAELPTSTTAAAGFGGGNSAPSAIFDVTRLKRAMVHHTKKFGGYRYRPSHQLLWVEHVPNSIFHLSYIYLYFSQQDAQEFLSDLLEALHSELQDRFAVFADFAEFARRGGTIHGGNPDELSGSHLLSVSTPAATVGEKRARADFEEINCATVKKMRGDSDSAAFDLHPTPQRPSASTASSAANPNLVTPEAVARNSALLCSPCSRMMQSTVHVELRCVSCGQARDRLSEEYQHFPLDLSANSSGGSSGSQELGRLLCGFFSDETRELTCEHCSEGTHAVAHTSLAQLPAVLVLQLKRFEYDTCLQKMVKVGTEVDFPRSLDLSAFCGGDPQVASSSAGAGLWSTGVEAVMKDAATFDRFWEAATVGPASTEPCTGARYELTSVLRHRGSSGAAGGHYICDVRQAASASKSEQTWRRFDDSVVSEVGQDTVMGERDTPYLFFYTKC